MPIGRHGLLLARPGRHGGDQAQAGIAGRYRINDSQYRHRITHPSNRFQYRRFIAFGQLEIN